MKKKKIATIGHFAIGTNLLNGQTIKTKIVTGELARQFGKEEIIQIDTHGGKIGTLIKAPFQVLKALKNARNVIIFPAQNGLRVFAPLLCFFNRFFKRKLFYVVIGGWLPELLGKKPGLGKKLETFSGIYVETDSMKQTLEKQGFSNVELLPNCKQINICDASEIVFDPREPHRLCTFSRVMKEKGIEDAVKAVRQVNQANGRTVYTLDIYGQVDAKQTEWFATLQKDFPEFIRYRGEIPFEKSVETLKPYFLLLFPTYYEGEGFAGTLIDAMAAGLPVIASDWKYNSEIVTPQTGWLFEARRIDELVSLLETLKETDLSQLKIHCIEKAKDYLPENVLKKLTESIENE